MKIHKLKLRNYRNYEQLDIQFHPMMNLITGENAQGKTNLIESIVYLANARSHRILDDQKLIKKEEDFASIQALFSKQDQQYALKAILHHQGKSLFIQNQPVSKVSDFIGKCNIVLFAPDDLTLFQDQPKERRALFNQELSKLFPQYFHALQMYQKLLKERNVYLKQSFVEEDFLDTMDLQIAREEYTIMTYRRKCIAYLQNKIQKHYQDIALQEDQIQMIYKPNIVLEDVQVDTLYQYRVNNRLKDMEYKVTTVGCHKDDIHFFIRNINVVQFASQGQKRMLLLAFKLSLIDLIEEIKKDKPIVLLDDVLSELDIKRQQSLLKKFDQGYQCMITTTHLPAIIKDISYKQFEIAQGTLQGGK